MDEAEIAKNALEAIANAATDEPGTLAEYVVEVSTDAGGFIANQAGRLIAGSLLKTSWAKLCEKLKQSQAAGKVDEDFAATPHGAALLQEALRAMCDGLDERRAKAVRDVFLGLAKTPVKEAIEKVQQIEILRMAAELTPWELVVLNVVENYSIETYNVQWANRNQEGLVKEQEIIAMTKDKPTLHEGIRERAGADDGTLEFLKNAATSLVEKNILKYILYHPQDVNRRDTGPQRYTRSCLVHRDGAFTPFGWKLAVHLYSATDGTDESTHD